MTIRHHFNMARRLAFRLACLGRVAAWPFALTIVLISSGPLSAWEPNSKSVAAGEKTLKLDSKKVTESSGLAFSLVDSDCLWTHNDSGGKARLFAFNQKGNRCGELRLKGVDALDWEDIAGFDDTVPRLLIADVGDNQKKRKSVSLYLLDEPDPKSKTDTKSFQHLVVTYSDGPHNCESVAVDPKRRRIFLLSKTALFAKVHEIKLPARPVGQAAEAKQVDQVMVVANLVCNVMLPMATGMDIDPQSGDVWVCSYFYAFRFPAKSASGQSLALSELFSQIPEQVALPKLRQIEAIAVDQQSRVWVTSEGAPTKLQRVAY